MLVNAKSHPDLWALLSAVARDQGCNWSTMPKDEHCGMCVAMSCGWCNFVDYTAPYLDFLNRLAQGLDSCEREVMVGGAEHEIADLLARKPVLGSLDTLLNVFFDGV